MKSKISYLLIFILLITSILIWTVIFSNLPAKQLEIDFFNVGQGDAIFIETPNHKQVLIDGGPDDTVLEKLGQEMHFNDRTIDLVILTHPDEDHITGLVKVLDNFEIRGIIVSGFKNDTSVYQQWTESIEKKNIPITIAQTGQIINLDENIAMKILWPDQITKNNKANNHSVVVQLVYHQAEILLTGDIEKEIEKQLVNQSNLESDVLKIPHHGSKTSSSFNFIKSVNPKISIISVGRDNSYGHPNDSVLERLKESLILRTDKDGDIELLTNGRELRIGTSLE